MIFLIKKASVAFKLRIELDSLFRPFTSHQTTDSSEGSNATQFNRTLKWDIWSLQMNVKHVLFEQRTKVMTRSPFKGESSILVLSAWFVFAESQTHVCRECWMMLQESMLTSYGAGEWEEDCTAHLGF